MSVVREVEEGDLPFLGAATKYGIKSSGTVGRWVRKYGNGNRGKVIHVQTPKEVDEKKQLKARIRQLERALADSNIDAALERAYTRMALKRAGIEDVDEFKKKAAVQLRVTL